MVMKVVCLVLVLTAALSSGGEEKKKTTLSAALTPADLARLKNVLSPGWDLSDPLLTAYALLSYDHLNLPYVRPAADVCIYFTSNLDKSDATKLELLFALSSAMLKLPNCKVNLKPAVKTALQDKLKASPTSSDIFYASHVLKNAGAPFDSNKLVEALKAAVKADDSAHSLGYAFWSNSNVGKAGQYIWERVEDVLAQADEVDGIYLQFEGGLSVTASVINGLIRLSESLVKPLPLTTEQVVKFGNYLVSRKTVSTPRGVYLLSSALDVLSKNKVLKPVYVGLAGPTILSEENKVISIRASDLLGRPVEVSVQLESLQAKDSETKVDGVQLVQATPSTTDKTLFTVDLKGKNIPRGFYTVNLNAKSSKNDKTLILQPSSGQLKVIGPLGTVTARVGVSHADARSTVKWTDLNKGQKIATQLETLDSNHKLVVKVATSETLHQVFLVLRCKETGGEVAFVATQETDGGKGYIIEVDLSTNAKDLSYKSGKYELVLLLGDFLIQDSVEWTLGEVNLKLGQGKVKAVNPLYAVEYGAKKEIQHMFRQPEPRPPRFLSDAFTLLVLSPLVILLGLWFKIGINVNNFPVSISAIGFHLGLISLFGVYTLFWIKLSMFEALKWMAGPSLLTFVTGNRLLNYIAERRK